MKKDHHRLGCGRSYFPSFTNIWGGCRHHILGRVAAGEHRIRLPQVASVIHVCTRGENERPQTLVMIGGLAVLLIVR